MHLFHNIPWVADVIMVSLGASIYYAFAIVWPRMVFTLYTSDLTHGGWLSCVTGSAINCGQIIGGAFSRQIGKQRWQLVGAAIFTGAFLGGAACATPSNENTVIGLLFIGCFSVGWLESVRLAMSGILVEDQSEIGTAVGVAGSIRSAVSTIASTINTVILTNRLENTIPIEVPAKLIAAGLPPSSVTSFLAAVAAGTPDGFASVEGLTNPIKVAGIEAYKVASSHAYQTVFFTTIAFSGVGIVFSFFTPNVDDLMSDRVTVTLSRMNDEELSAK